MRIERSDGDVGVSTALDMLTADGRLLVLGPVGSGRTTLLTALAASEAGRRRRVWWCRGRHAGAATGDAPMLHGSPSSSVDAVAAEPTTLLVDDADRLDDALLQRVLMLIERRDELALRVAVAHRPVPPPPWLATVDEALLGPRGALHLGPLTLGDVAGVLAERGRDDDPADVLARTGGWPELLAAALEPGRSIDDLVAARLARLATDEQRVLRAVCFGLPVGTAAMSAATAVDADAADRAIAAATAVGLLHDDVVPCPVVADAVRAATPSADRARIAGAVASAPPDVLTAAARHLLSTGDRSPEAGTVYERAGDALRATEPQTSAELYDAAARAGCADLDGRRAAAALAAGHVTTAVSLASRAIDADGSHDPALRRSAAAGWAHLGRPDLAADAYLAAGGDPTLAIAPLLAAGRLEEAQRVRSTSSARTDPASLLADGVLAWAAGDADRALELFGRCARLVDVVGGVGEWPDSPHALAAIIAAHWLDVDRAAAFAAAAIDGAVGGPPFATRHALVDAWVALRAGRTDGALAALDGAPAAVGRDAVSAIALRAALALRSDEPDELPALHRAAVDVGASCRPDPFAPGLAAELAHLAARVGGHPAAVLDPLGALSRALGDPPTIAVHLAWAHLLVAVATDDGPAARRAADALLALAASPGVASDATAGEPSRLLADAGAAFADVIAGIVDAEAVRSVATRLVERGLVFEASRLVGAAGLRCTEPAAARALLGELRRLRATQVRTGPSGRRAVAELSDRELDVARRVLDGRTHREIGAELYISAKTVEHHVARIRQKLGAGTRAELLAGIRAELAWVSPLDEKFRGVRPRRSESAEAGPTRRGSTAATTSEFLID